MKRNILRWGVLVLLAALLMGCGPSRGETEQPSQPVATEKPAATPEETTEQSSTEASSEVTEGEQDAVPNYTEVYAQQIQRYYTALSEQWEESKYFENEMSAQPFHYYEGNPLENVGFGFPDLDNDGSRELVIGAIAYAQRDPSVFEIWTLTEGEPVLLAQGGVRNRYCLQYDQVSSQWSVANEASSSAANSGVYYLVLREGKFEVLYAVILDATADVENPWFMAYDMDWDAANDIPIEEETAMAVMEENRKRYTAMEYIPYSQYKQE